MIIHRNISLLLARLVAAEALLFSDPLHFHPLGQEPA